MPNLAKPFVTSVAIQESKDIPDANDAKIALLNIGLGVKDEQGRPLRRINLRSTFMNPRVESESQTSRWTARKARHVNTHP